MQNRFSQRLERMAKKGSTSLAFAALFLAGGCVDVGSEVPQRPLLSTFISAVYIDQFPPSYDDPGVEGYIDVCANSTNPNNVDVFFNDRAEFYVVRNLGGGDELVLVETLGSGYTDTRYAHQNALSVASFHKVRGNETVENGSTRYAIRFVSEVLTDDWRAHFSPPLMSDKWVNVTFTPFGRGELYREGQAGCPQAYG